MHGCFHMNRWESGVYVYLCLSKNPLEESVPCEYKPTSKSTYCTLCVNTRLLSASCCDTEELTGSFPLPLFELFIWCWITSAVFICKVLLSHIGFGCWFGYHIYSGHTETDLFLKCLLFIELYLKTAFTVNISKMCPDIVYSMM